MVEMSKWMSRRAQLALGGAVLVALGVAGGAGATAMTRPSVEMAPASPTAIASLAQRQGIVTVRGRIAEAYGDRFVVADASGKVLVDAGRGATTLRAGTPLTVQGRFADGQLRASFVVGPDGTVEPVGPGRDHRRPHGPGGLCGPGGPGGPGGPDGPGHDGPPPPPPGGCGPVAGTATAAPTAPAAAVEPPSPR